MIKKCWDCQTELTEAGWLNFCSNCTKYWLTRLLAGISLLTIFLTIVFKLRFG